jgi:hypothetical protein
VRLFFETAGRASKGEGGTEITATAENYMRALELGIECLQKRCRAGLGDRTMMDALVLASEAATKPAKGVGSF